MDEFPEGLIELVAMLPYVIVKVIKVKITGAIREHRYNKLMDLRLLVRVNVVRNPFWA